MCSIDLDPCEVWEEHVRTARKLYHCITCGKPIKPGEKYVAHFSVFERDSTYEKLCMVCERVRKEFADAHGQSFTPGALTEMLNECVGEGDDESAKWKRRLDTIYKRIERNRRAA